MMIKPRIRVKMRRQAINAQGLKLFDPKDCLSLEAQISPSEEQRRMARILNLSPNHPESWPFFAIEELIMLEKKRGTVEMNWYVQHMLTN